MLTCNISNGAVLDSWGRKGIWSTLVSTESSLSFEGRGLENITSAVLNSGGIKAFSLAGRA